VVYSSPAHESSKVHVPDLDGIEHLKFEGTPIAPMINETDIKDYGLSRRLF